MADYVDRRVRWLEKQRGFLLHLLNRDFPEDAKLSDSERADKTQLLSDIEDELAQLEHLRSEVEKEEGQDYDYERMLQLFARGSEREQQELLRTLNRIVRGDRDLGLAGITDRLSEIESDMVVVKFRQVVITVVLMAQPVLFAAVMFVFS